MSPRTRCDCCDKPLTECGGLVLLPLGNDRKYRKMKLDLCGFCFAMIKGSLLSIMSSAGSPPFGRCGGCQIPFDTLNVLLISPPTQNGGLVEECRCCSAWAKTLHDLIETEQAALASTVSQEKEEEIGIGGDQSW